VKEALQALTDRVASLETRIFNRQVGSQSIYDEIRYATDDRILPAIDALPKS
jgi:hypothetical protein